MAQRRMFSKSITNSSQFLMMPQSSQNLYFHLGMNADDDGFCEHFTIMRMTESKPDDLKVLQAKGFVRVFDDKVLVIIDWKENNYLRSDRYTPSKYLEIYKEEIRALASNNIKEESGTPMVYQMETQVRLGKERIDILGPSPSAPASDIQYVPLEEEIKSLRKKEVKSDPELTVKRDIIGFFIRKSKEYHNDYCPIINLPAALRLVNGCLDFSNPTEIKEWIEWYLQSDLYEILGSDIKTCLCTASYNKYKDYRRKHD